MSALTLQSSSDPAMTMTSREIADLTGKEHKNVLADARKMLADLGKAAADFSATAQIAGPNNSTREIEVLNLPKRETLILVSGYSVELRAKIIDRWQELEEQARNPIAALSRLDLLKLAMDSEQERLKLESQVAAQAPKVQAFDRIATSDGSLCITDAAKTLQVQPRHLTKVLQEKHWVYRRPMGTGWLAYQDRIQAGLLEHKVTTGERGDGHEWSNTQVRITPKGLTKLAESLHQGGLH